MLHDVFTFLSALLFSITSVISVCCGGLLFDGSMQDVKFTSKQLRRFAGVIVVLLLLNLCYDNPPYLFIGPFMFGVLIGLYMAFLDRPIGPHMR